MARRAPTTWCCVAAAAVALACARDGRADDAPNRRGDASHGRFAGDLAVAASIGATVGPRAPRAAGDVRLRYLSTAGLFASYEDGALTGSRAEPRRALALGVEMRPLFLARWATGRDLGAAYLDLLIDSFGLELGAVFLQPAGARFGARPGLQAGIGLELPLLGRASGPFLGVHGGVRWSDAALTGAPLTGPSDRALYLMLTVGWQQLFGARVVDVGEPSTRAGR